MAIAIAAFLLGWSGATALADGDPASDVLASQSLFLPQDAGASASQQAQLASLMSTAARSGYQIHVAVIASPADLGSIGELWRQPRTYAHFLAQELSLTYRGPLLVVMPDGYGVYGPSGEASGQSALAGLPSPGARLGAAALTATSRLAAAEGHPLPLPSTGGGSRSSGGETSSWVVFALGFALVALAWSASLRRRPPQIGRGRTAS